MGRFLVITTQITLKSDLCKRRKHQTKVPSKNGVFFETEKMPRSRWIDCVGVDLNTIKSLEDHSA